MIKEWSLKNCVVGHVEDDQKLFGAGQEDGLGASALMSSGISARGKNPGRGRVDTRARGAQYERVPTYFYPVVIPQRGEDPAARGGQPEPVAPRVLVLDPAPRVEVERGVAVVAEDRAHERVARDGDRRVRVEVARVERAPGARVERGLVARLVVDALDDVDLAPARPV